MFDKIFHRRKKFSQIKCLTKKQRHTNYQKRHLFKVKSKNNNDNKSINKINNKLSKFFGVAQINVTYKHTHTQNKK